MDFQGICYCVSYKVIVGGKRIMVTTYVMAATTMTVTKNSRIKRSALFFGPIIWHANLQARGTDIKAANIMKATTLVTSEVQSDSGTS